MRLCISVSSSLIETNVNVIQSKVQFYTESARESLVGIMLTTLAKSTTKLLISNLGRRRLPPVRK